MNNNKNSKISNDKDLRETVEHIAKLSNLTFSESEIDILAPKFSKILHHIEAIEELDLDGIEPMTHVNESYNMTRPDIAETSLTSKEALKNAPKKNDNFFKVPKMFS